MKKVICFIVITLIFSLTVLPVFAAGEIVVIKLTSDVATLSAGETATVVCNIKSPIGMGGFQFDICFDSTRLEVTSYSIKKLSIGDLSTKSNTTNESINADGYFRILYLYAGSGALKTADIVTLTFKAKADCYSGQVILDTRNITVGDTNAQKMTVSKISAAINVEGKDPSTSSEPSSSDVTSSGSTSSDSTSSDSSSSGSASSGNTTSDVTSSDSISSGSTSSDVTSSGSTSSGTSSGSGSGLSEIVVDGSKTVKVDENKPNIEINVDGNKKSIDISGIPKDEDSSVIVEGGDNLKEGENDVKITVTDKNGSVKEYNVKVIKGKDNSFITYILFAAGAVILLAAAVTLVLIIKKKKIK